MTQPVSITANRADFLEIACDLTAYVTVQGIRGNAFSSGKVMKEYLPFLITVAGYNLVIRNAIAPMMTQLPQGVTAGVTGEVLTLGSLLWAVDNFAVSGKKKPFLEHMLDVLGTRGISEQYLKIKDELGINGNP